MVKASEIVKSRRQEISNVVKSAREKLQMPKTKFAILFETSGNTVMRWERGSKVLLDRDKYNLMKLIAESENLPEKSELDEVFAHSSIGRYYALYLIIKSII